VLLLQHTDSSQSRSGWRPQEQQRSLLAQALQPSLIWHCLLLMLLLLMMMGMLVVPSRQATPRNSPSLCCRLLLLPHQHGTQVGQVLLLLRIWQG
jgi:hypothetical protein